MTSSRNSPRGADASTDGQRVKACAFWIGFDLDSRAGIGLWSKSPVIAEGCVRSQSCTSRANCDFAGPAEIRAAPENSPEIPEIPRRA
jgi:hypothetical protein